MKLHFEPDLGIGNRLTLLDDALLVFRDSAFAADVAKTNLTAIHQHGLDTVRSL